MRLRQIIVLRVHEQADSTVFLTMQHTTYVNKIQALVMQFAHNSFSNVSFRHRGKNTMYVECDSKVANMEDLEVFQNTEIKFDFSLRFTRTKKGIILTPYITNIQDLIY